MGVAAPARPWRPAERARFKLPDEQPVSQWAAENVTLDGKITARPGPFRPDAWQVEIMDAWSDPDVEQLTVVAAAQCGKSTIFNACIGWTADNKPAPTLLVMPADKYAARRMKTRLKPMFEQSPTLRRHITGRKSDWTKEEVELDRMHLWVTGANSPAALADVSVCNVILDEVGKYPPQAGKEADPVSLAKRRTESYAHRRKIATVSTPNRSDDLICREQSKSTDESFWVPCKHCKAYQPLEWAQVKWPKAERDPDRIQTKALAWYECAHCGKRIKDTATNRTWMMERGRWCPKGCTVDRRRRVRGKRPDPRHRGFHVVGMMVKAWSRLAATFLKAGGDRILLMDFFNSDLALPFDDQVLATDEDQLKAIEVDYPRGTVHEDVLILTAGVDIGERAIHYVIRGWSPTDGWLVELGEVYGRRDLEQVLFKTAYRRPDGSGPPMEVTLACIDSGYDPEWVNSFCRRYSDRARPIKGDSEAKLASGSIFTGHGVDKDARGQVLKGGLIRYHLNSDYLHRTLNGMIAPAEGEPPRLHNFPGLPEEYYRHMVAEALVETRTGGQIKHAWKRKPGYGSPHYRDCERYALVAAEMLYFRHLQPEQFAAPPAPRPAGDGGRRRKGGWMGRGRRRGDRW